MDGCSIDLTLRKPPRAYCLLFVVLNLTLEPVGSRGVPRGAVPDRDLAYDHRPFNLRRRRARILHKR